MKARVAILFLLFLFPTVLFAQLNESFSDGDYTKNPVWITSNPDDWIVNPVLQLQSNNTTANGIFYISTASTLAVSAEWELKINLAFNTSSTNYVDVYLISASSDLTLSNNTGYFVRLGNTADNVCLYRKDGATSKLLITGITGLLNHSNNQLKLKVTRDEASEWKLYRDSTGTGNHYYLEGSITDTVYTSSSWFGIYVKQSTSSFFKKHFFDDIVMQPYLPDVTPPGIVSATVTSSSTLDILFNEALDTVSGKSVSNYSVNNSIGNPVTAIIDKLNPALVHLTFSKPFQSGMNQVLTVIRVKDETGNAITQATASFVYQAPYTATQYDIIIDEIMCDPLPIVGLPNTKWIELKNTSSFPVNLKGWRIANSVGNSGTMPDFILQPDSFVIICTGSAATSMGVFGSVISVTSFPSLKIDGDEIILYDDKANVIHTVKYTKDWYRNEFKQDGGWTLEMIDMGNPCSGETNWRASTDLSGGTPGRKNSIDAINPDQDAPKLLRAYATDNRNIVLVFDEPLNNSTASDPNQYNISNGIGQPQSATCIAPLFYEVNLTLNTSLIEDEIYTVQVNVVSDCSGNSIGRDNIIKVGLSSFTDSFSVIINEVLYHPHSTGEEYIELYNRSNKIIDLKNLSVAGRNSYGVINNIASLSSVHRLLFPQEFIVISKNPDLVKSEYATLNPDAFAKVANLLTLNNTKGDIIILNEQGNIVDELKYDDKWQFSLLQNTAGVSLERIDYNANTQSQNNWHSAASDVGYGTPTYTNSQYKAEVEMIEEISVLPKIISPDNDGVDDFATISYHFPEPGYVANITIFDASGRPVRYLQNSALCGTSGNFIWDGLGEKNQKLQTGIYIVYAEIFNLNGETKRFKYPLVIARKIP